MTLRMSGGVWLSGDVWPAARQGGGAGDGSGRGTAAGSGGAVRAGDHVRPAAAAGSRCRADGGAGRGMLMSKDAIADVYRPSPT